MTAQMATVTDGAGKTYRMPRPVTVVNDPATKTVFGADYTPAADLAKRYPGARYTAIYGPTGMPAAAKLNAVPASVAILGVSFKGATDQVAVAASLNAARRPGRLLLVEPLHEFNRSTAHGGPTPDAYNRDFDKLATVVRRLDPTGQEIGLTQTYMGYAARHPEAGREWDKFAREDVDAVGVDLEWDDKLGTKAYPTPAALQAIALEIRDGHPAKVPVIYREFAWRQLAYDTTGKDLAKFYVDQADYAVAHDVWIMSIYDTDGSTGKYRLLDGSPALAAVKKIIG